MNIDDVDKALDLKSKNSEKTPTNKLSSHKDEFILDENETSIDDSKTLSSGSKNQNEYETEQNAELIFELKTQQDAFNEEDDDLAEVEEDIEDEITKSVKKDNKTEERVYSDGELQQKSTEELLGIYEDYISKDYDASNKTLISTIKIILSAHFKDARVQALNEFIKNGGEEKDFDYHNSIEDKFKQASLIYKEKRQKYLEEVERQQRENFELKLKMLDDLKDLINSNEPLKKTYDEFNNIRIKWNEIGAVPRSEANNLWQTYHLYVESFYEKVKINRELRDYDLRKNLESKISLCEKAEALLIEQSITKSFKLLQKYHEEWKEIGPVPSDRAEDIWERFKTATDKINERRREYYSKINEQQQKNYEAKLAICEKTEELLSQELKNINDYQKATNEITKMMHLWGTIGRAPKQLNDEIWGRFNALVNNFFNNKKDFFQSLNDQQTENYNKKIQICLRAESLKNSTNWEKATNEFINLQKEWRKIGPVPLKYKDKLWQRFRNACNEFFNNKAKYLANINEIQKENLRLKKELVKKIQDYQYSTDKKENLNIIKNFQREWINIGHVPIENKDEIQEIFRTAINKQLDKLKITSTDLSTMEFQSYIEQLKNTKDGNIMLNKKKSELKNQLLKIKNNILLWENNIGFFANSKNADILKEEFIKKIEDAKQEVQLIENKIKILDKKIHEMTR